MSNIIKQLEAEQINKELPDFQAGDTVVVQVEVKEGNRKRLQAFEGVVIAKRNRGLNSSFTVRKNSHGEGVERVFQTYSPLVNSIKVKRYGKVRRAQVVLFAKIKRQSCTPKRKNLIGDQGGCRIVVITPASQAGKEGSIPFTRSTDASGNST